MDLKRQMDRCQTAALSIMLWMLLQTGLDFQKKITFRIAAAGLYSLTII